MPVVGLDGRPIPRGRAAADLQAGLRALAEPTEARIGPA
jgi:hypothetical protein